MSYQRGLQIANEHVRKGIALYQSGRFRAAAAKLSLVLQEGVKVSWVNYEPLFYLALSFYEIGRLVDSLKIWRQLHSFAQDRKNILLNIGCTYHRMGRVDQAIRYYKAELKLNPVCDESLYNLGSIYYGRNNFRIASIYLEKLYAQRPTAELVAGRLADCYFKMGRLQDEIRLYENYLSIKPKDSWCLNNLGAALIDAGENSRAQLLLNRAVATEPRDKIAKRNLRRAVELRSKILSNSTKPSGIKSAEATAKFSST
jgi:tetratricopeptide (TPR) repeat protein